MYISRKIGACGYSVMHISHIVIVENFLRKNMRKSRNFYALPDL